MYIILIIYKYGSVYLRWREKKSLRRHRVFHDRTNYLDFCNEIVCQRYIGFQGAPSWILSKGLRLVSNDRQTDPILRCLFLRWLNSLLIYSPMLFIYPKLSQKKPNLKLLFIIIYIRPMQENICPGKDFIINFAMTLHHGSRSLLTLYSKALCMWSISQIGPKGKKSCYGQAILDGQTDYYNANCYHFLCEAYLW